MFRKYDFVFRQHEGARQKFQNIVGAIAKGDAFRCNAVFFCQRALQHEAVAVGITVNVRKHVARRGQCPRARTKGVFVAGEFDRAGDAVLALQLLDRLTRFVRFKLPHAGRGQIYRFEFHLRML